MDYNIKIDPKISFQQILNLLSKHVTNHSFSIKHLEGVGKLRSGESMLDFENRIKKNKMGISLNIKELEELNEDLQDIVNLHLIHYKNSDTSVETNGYDVDISIMFFDSSFWLISMTNKILFDDFILNFKEAVQVTDNSLQNHYIDWL